MLRRSSCAAGTCEEAARARVVVQGRQAAGAIPAPARSSELVAAVGLEARQQHRIDGEGEEAVRHSGFAAVPMLVNPCADCRVRPVWTSIVTSRVLPAISTAHCGLCIARRARPAGEARTRKPVRRSNSYT